LYEDKGGAIVAADPVLLYVVAAAAVLIACCGGGLLFLLHMRRELVKNLLREKCSSAGVSFVIPPTEGAHRPPGKKRFFRPGIVCMTEYELIFIPLWGKKVVQVPRSETTLDDGGKATMVTTEGHGTFRAARVSAGGE